MTQPGYRLLPTERLEEMVRDPRLPSQLKAQVQDELLRRFMAESAPSGPAAGPPPASPMQPYPGVRRAPPPMPPRQAPPRQVPPRQMPLPPSVSPPPAPPPHAPPPRPAKGSSPVAWVLLGVFLTIAGLVLAVGYFASKDPGGGGDEIQYSSRCYVTSIDWCPLAVTVAVGSPCTCTDVVTGVVTQGVVR